MLLESVQLGVPILFKLIVYSQFDILNINQLEFRKKKTFDSREWTFILTTLKHFGFNEFGIKLNTVTFKRI